MSPSLQQVRQAILATGAVRAEAVEQLKGMLLTAWPIGRAEAELLFEIHADANGPGNDPAWPAFFVEALTDHLLGDPGCSNTLGEDKATYLISKLGPQQRAGDVEIELLVNVCSRAQSVPEPFLDYVLSAIARAIREEELIAEGRVGQLRRVVWSQGSADRPGVGRQLADFLFDLNDAMTGRANHDSWTELFVEAVGNHVLEDEASPGVVDESETEWLARRMKADDQYDRTEKALFQQIRHSIAHDEVWGGIRSDDLQASTPGMVASLYSRACGGGKGGDLYYVSVSASDMLTRIAVADVSGHGRAVTDMSQWIYESLAARINSADGHEVLADLSRLASDRGYKALTTAIVVTFHRPESRLYFACAGHPPGFVRRASDGRWQRLTLDDGPGAANLPLGVDADMRYDRGQIGLGAGDRLFLYTDGLVEAPDSNDQLFGTERLVAALEAEAGESVKDVKDAVLAALRDHTGGRWTHDDVTFMVVEVRD